MGLYLGANELGGGGSGGGNLLSDPREMNRAVVYTPRCEVKSSETGHGFIGAMWGSLFDTGRGGSGNLTLSTVDTYVTTHDITSGAGILRLLAFPSLHLGAIGDTSTCRITLDGEVYIIAPSLLATDTGGYYKPLMGNFVLGGMARITNTTGNGTDTNNFGNHYRGKHTTTYPMFDHGFTNGSDTAAQWTYVPTVASLGQLGGVSFKESLKVEFKADQVGIGAYSDANKIGSLVTTF